MERVRELIMEQERYALMNGGYDSIHEADDTYNDMNRKIIREFVKENPKAVMGKYSGFPNGCFFKEIDTDELRNFCCDFVLPEPNDGIKNAIDKMGGNGFPNYALIYELITALGGVCFIWF